eukprot:scaffold7815_cov248-Pinguiococcus_pyrenoidosus.AAC.6
MTSSASATDTWARLTPSGSSSRSSQALPAPFAAMVQAGAPGRGAQRTRRRSNGRDERSCGLWRRSRCPRAVLQARIFPPRFVEATFPPMADEIRPWKDRRNAPVPRWVS